MFLFRCSPEDLGFPSFATSGPTGAGGLAGMPYHLKSSPYLMTVDTLHSMGYPGKIQKCLILFEL